MEVGIHGGCSGLQSRNMAVEICGNPFAQLRGIYIPVFKYGSRYSDSLAATTLLLQLMDR